MSGPNELESALAAMAKAGTQAVIIQPLFDPHRAILVELATKNGWRERCRSRETTAAGGLVSISANWLALYERAAVYVDKIIKGASLPICRSNSPRNSRWCSI